MKKKWVIFGVIGVVVLGGGYWAYKHFSAKPTTSTNIMAPAKMGDVSKVITATGTVNYPSTSALSFPQSGEITEIDVKQGDTVKAGQVLAKIDNTKLKMAVMQQQANLTNAKDKLQSLKDSFNAQTKAQAEADLAGAQQKVVDAQQALSTAQSGGVALEIASAQAEYNLAQANVTQAQAAVDDQAKGPKAADLQSAQTNIDLAQSQLAGAQTDLANATITSPYDALVLSAPLQLYQQSDAKSIITITPSGASLNVNASIDQADISQIKAGQIVDVTLDAYPNEHNSGVVNLVDLQGTTVQNVTTFEVTITLDKASDLLRAGMNANVSIVVAEVKNVLTVPSEAVKTIGNQKEVQIPITSSTGTSSQSSQSSQSSNTRSGFAGRTAANIKFVPVVIGLDDGTNVEIKSGISEGQEVVIGTRSTTTAAKAATSGFSLGGGSTRALGGATGGGGYGGGGARGN